VINFKKFLMMTEGTHKSQAVVKYGPAMQAVARIDQGISDFYRSLIPKAYGVQPQAWPAHITIVRKGKETPTKMDAWGKHEGRTIEFTYDTTIQTDGTYFWLNAWSEEVGDIREELGLPRYRDDSAFGGVSRQEYHITLGNVKNSIKKP
jgi:hypothetical protein